MSAPVRGRPRGRLRAASAAGLVVVAAAAGVAVASSAAAEPVVEAVTIDCIGDSIVGHVGIQDPEFGTAQIELHADGGVIGPTRAAAFEVIDSTTVRTEPGMFEIAYSFTLAQHHGQYRVVVRIGGSTRSSQIVNDGTCQPPAEVPEAGAAIAVPLAMGAAGGALWWLRRRRTATR